MKINPVIAIVAFVLGLSSALVAYLFSTLNTEIVISASIALAASVLGLLGIYLFDKDYRLAMIQYVLCGLSLFVSTSLLGLLGCVFFIVAACTAYLEKDKYPTINTNTFDDIRFYGNEAEIRGRYMNLPKPNSDSKSWTIPIITLILLFVVGMGGGVIYQIDLQDKADSIEIYGINNDLNSFYGYYSGYVDAIITSQRNIDSVNIKGSWYSSDGTLIDETIDTNLVKSLKENQDYQIYFPYYHEASKKPSKLVINVYEGLNDEPLYIFTVYFD